MPSPYPPAPQLLHSLSLASHLLSSNSTFNKFPGCKLIFMPTMPLSTISTPRTTLLHGPILSGKKDRLSPREVSRSVGRNRISLVKKDDGSPFEEEEELESLDVYQTNSRLRVKTFVDAIRALPREKRTDILNTFSKDGGNWSISDFNEILVALVIANEPELALKLFDNLSSHGVMPDSWTYSVMIRCHCEKNDCDKAKVVLDHMTQNGFNPHVATFTTLINSLCKRGKLQEAFEVFKVMDDIGCRPTVQTYNCLLKGLCYVGRVEEAFELFVDIKKSSIEPDIYTYTVMMDGFCKVGRSDEGMELLNEALGRGLTPSSVTYNTLFSGYNMEGRPLEGIRVLKQMKQSNCKPDYISYNTLLHGLLLWRKIRVALRIYKEMVGNGFEVDERLLNRLLRALCRTSLEEIGMLEDAYELFEKMRKRVSVIEHNTYGLVIQALCVARKADDALVNLRQMISQGYTPKIMTTNNVIRALCTEGKVEKAVFVLVLMSESHKIPDRISYDLLIHELNRQERFLGSRNVYGAALVRGVIPHKKPPRQVSCSATTVSVLSFPW